jgi:hypothetical protein
MGRPLIKLAVCDGNRCGRKILWTRRPGGKRLALNPRADSFLVTFTGDADRPTFHAVTAAELVERIDYIQLKDGRRVPAEAIVGFHQSHWMSCPSRDFFRRPHQ